jgi:hypothetical protein
VVTAGVLAAGAEQLLQKLENVAATVSGDAQIAINASIAQLSGLISQIREVAKDSINTPVDKLTAKAQDLARALQIAVGSIDELLTRQQTCFFQNLQQFTAALQTAASDSISAIPLAGSPSPRLYSVKFDGHAGGVIPASGGNATVTGYKVWLDQPPIVRLYQPDKTTPLATLTPSRAADDNSLSVVIEGKQIGAHAGQCLYLGVKVQAKKAVGPIKWGSGTVADLYLPLCIPDIEKEMTLEADASISYDCTSIQQSTLGAQVFRFDNSSCERPHNVSQTKGWPMPSGCHIIGLNDHRDEERNQSSIGLSYSNDSVTAAGSIDTASCLLGKLLHTSIWQHSVSPTISCTITKSETGSAHKQAQLRNGRAQICMDIPKSCNQTSALCSYTAKVTADKTPIASHESGRVSVSENGAAIDSATEQGLTISGQCTPHTVGSSAQVCVSVTSGSCGY